MSNDKEVNSENSANEDDPEVQQSSGEEGEETEGSGGFLIAKEDIGKVERPKMVLWRIDGKALLEKFEPFEEEDKRKYRNTNVYVGWSAQRKSLYLPITVNAQKQQGQNMIVEFDIDTVKDTGKPNNKTKSKPAKTKAEPKSKKPRTKAKSKPKDDSEGGDSE